MKLKIIGFCTNVMPKTKSDQTQISRVLKFCQPAIFMAEGGRLQFSGSSYCFEFNNTSWSITTSHQHNDPEVDPKKLIQFRKTGDIPKFPVEINHDSSGVHDEFKSVSDFTLYRYSNDEIGNFDNVSKFYNSESIGGEDIVCCIGYPMERFEFEFTDDVESSNDRYNISVAQSILILKPSDNDLLVADGLHVFDVTPSENKFGGVGNPRDMNGFSGSPVFLFKKVDGVWNTYFVGLVSNSLENHDGSYRFAVIIAPYIEMILTQAPDREC